jgi:hypothetical protein
MADAVIIDDGGSTRIKQLKSATASGKMDDFLDKKKGHPDGDFSNIRIVALKGDGTTLLTRNEPMNKSDSFTIESVNAQLVLCEMENNGKTIHLSLDALPAVKALGVEPMVEAKDHGQRRYVVSNSGPITKVDFKDDSAGGTIKNLFDITASPDKDSIYTMVILT